MRIFGREVYFSLPKRQAPDDLSKMRCFGCGANGEEAKKLIAGRAWAVFICDRCVEDAAGTLGGTQQPDSRLIRHAQDGLRCSFCNKQVRLASSGDLGICGKCVSICESILAEDGRLEPDS